MNRPLLGAAPILSAPYETSGATPAEGRRRFAPAWNSGWLMAFCEWRRWRRLGFTRWATFCILLSSLHRMN